jgi:hypothetical protein
MHKSNKRRHDTIVTGTAEIDKFAGSERTCPQWRVLSVILALAVAVQPVQLRAEPGATAVVTVSAPTTARLVLWCSAGELSALYPTGAGKFAALYRAPITRLPTRVLIAVWDEASGEAARTTLALAARVTVPVETDPGAQVTLQLRGRRATARANAEGQARVTAWVGPDERVATVIARDVSGNARTLEMGLDVPRAASLFVAAPDELVAGSTARVFAFAVGEGTPTLTVAGATLDHVEARAGITTAVVRAPSVRLPSSSTAVANATSKSGHQGEATLTATLAGATAMRHVHFLAAAAAERPLSDWELGASISGRYSGALGGLALAIELRRRMAPSRFVLGLDLDARYAAGTVDTNSIALGGAALRFVGEARFRLTPTVAAVVALAIGATLVRERRVPASGIETTPADGGPALGATLALLKRLGPGWLTLAAGYSWAPLVGLSLANSDGGMVTLGYRAARWPRRRRRGYRRAHHGGGTLRVRRRRPAPAA